MKKFISFALSVLLIIQSSNWIVSAEESTENERDFIAQIDDVAFGPVEDIVQPATQPVSTSAILLNIKGKKQSFHYLIVGASILHQQKQEKFYILK